MPHRSILRIVPIAMSARLVKENLKKSKTPEDLVKKGTKNIVGTAMIREAAAFIDF